MAMEVNTIVVNSIVYNVMVDGSGRLSEFLQQPGPLLWRPANLDHDLFWQGHTL